MEVSGQLQAPAALPLGNSPRYPLDRRQDGPQNRSGRFEIEVDFSSCREPKPGRPAHNSRSTDWVMSLILWCPDSKRKWWVAYLTTLSISIIYSVDNMMNKCGAGGGWQGKPRYSVPRFLPHIPLDFIWDRTSAAAVGIRRLTAWSLNYEIYSESYGSLAWLSEFYYEYHPKVLIRNNPW
jgi:hypothetical protein